MDKLHTNDYGEQINISEAFRVMIAAIDERLIKFFDGTPGRRTLRLSNGEIFVKGDIS